MRGRRAWRRWRPDFGLDGPPIVHGLAALAVIESALVITGGLLANTMMIG